MVSDGDDQPTQDFASSFSAPFPVQWLFHERNQGQAAARNTGARAAHGELLLFLDDDTEPDQNTIAVHLAHFDQAGRIAVCGRIEECGDVAASVATDAFLQRAWEKRVAHSRSQIGVSGLDSIGAAYEQNISFGVNGSIRRDDFLRAGGFRTELRTTDEDMEFGLRLFRSGVRFVIEPNAVVNHRNSKSLTTYYQSAWRDGGKNDALRVTKFSERTPQTRQITAMHYGPLSSRLRTRVIYGNPWLRSVAAVLQSATNATRSRLLFGLWARLQRQVEYWGGVREAGLSAGDLRELAGQPGCALMFHSLSTPQSPEEQTYYLSASRFRRYMDWLRTSGRSSATVDEWIAGRFARNRALLTFDDGYDDLYTELLPLVAERGLKPLVFLVANPEFETNAWDHRRGLRRRNLLTTAQIREMQAHGVEFGSHTVNHRWLPECSDADLQHEIGDSKKMLEDRLGAPIRTFAYPFGGVDQRVRAAVAEAGYDLAFTVMPGLNFWTDPLCLHRADVHENISFFDFLCQLRTGLSIRQWFAARAHSLENDLPTQTLRSGVAVLHRATRPLLPKPSPRSSGSR